MQHCLNVSMMLVRVRSSTKSKRDTVSQILQLPKNANISFSATHGKNIGFDLS